MKILQVIPYFTPRRGGDVNVCYMLSKNLARRGHELTIITTDFEFDRTYAKTLEDSGVNIVVFPHLINVGLYLPSFGMNSWVRKEIQHFDVVHLHDFRSYQNSMISKYSRDAGVPYVLQAHGDIPKLVEKKMLKDIYDFIFGKKILSNVSRAIALTKTEANQYISAGVAKEKIRIIPNGLDLSEYDALPSRGEFKKKHSIEENTQLILYVGRLHKSKGISLLIEAFAKILKERNDIKLVLVGPDGGYKSTLEDLIGSLEIENNVIMTGFVDQIEKFSAYLDSDVFVTPSFLGFPITFLEACLFGKPIVTTKNGDELEWIDGRVGYITQYSVEYLKKAILKILNDDELSGKFGSEGTRLITEQFNWNRIVDDVETTYEECIKSQLMA